MGTYLTPVDVFGIDIQENQDDHTVKIVGKRGTMHFVPSRIISFAGLETTFLISNVYPNGVSLISSDTSLEKFFSWKKLFSGNSIFNDAISITGWFNIK